MKQLGKFKYHTWILNENKLIIYLRWDNRLEAS